MAATFNSTQAAMDAAQCRSERLPFSQPAMGMSAAASTTMKETVVCATVSLLLLVLFAVSQLLTLVLMGLIISLILISLTGSVRLEDLVGLTVRLAASTVRGD